MTLKIFVMRIVIVVIVVSGLLIVLKFSSGPMIQNNNFPLIEKWSVQIGKDIQHISTVDKNIILVKSGFMTYALDINNGKILWGVDLDWIAVDEPIKSINGVIFLTDTKGLVALDQLSGNILWRQSLQEPLTAMVTGVSLNVVTVSDPPYLKVFNLTDGILEWSRPVCRNTFQAYINANYIYVPCNGLVAIDIKTGEVVWQIQSALSTWNSAYDNGILFSSPDYKNITAFDVVNQREVWNVSLPNVGEQRYLVTGDYLLYADPNQFCSFRRVDGLKLWCAHDSRGMQNPTRTGNFAFIFNGTQKMINAYNLQTGERLGSLALKNFNIFTIYRQMMITSGEYLIFANGNRLYAYGK